MFSVLPPQEHTFTLKVKGSESGQTFEGSFTYARPTLGVSVEIGKTKAHLTGGLPVDEDTNAVVDMISTLRHTLVKYPDWWKECVFGTNLQDLNVLFALMKTCNDFEKSRKAKAGAKDEQDRPA